MITTAVTTKAKRAKEASRILYNCSTAQKNFLLKAISKRLRTEQKNILLANAKDMRNAKRKNLSAVLLDRLRLNEERIAQMISGVNEVIALDDPIGATYSTSIRPNKLVIEKMCVPLGTIGIIYEARPNVTIDASVLCLKTGNSVLLRGGSEAINTNRVLAGVIQKALRDAKLPTGCVEFIDTTDRKAVLAMIKQDKFLDVIIPRGSQTLISYIQENSSVPVIAHGEGNCHIYVDEYADLQMAEDIVFNAKVQRPSVCNAAEKLLIHKKIAKIFLPKIALRLFEAGVEILGDTQSRKIMKSIKPATEQDWKTEFLNLKIAVKIVQNFDDAVNHIGKYGSHHSDAIVTKNSNLGERFLREVDSAAVYVNASTRFTDGYEFGLGAEIGISTQKLHARGPMGLAELTSTKFIVRGNGQIRK
jgi:glutamate-5-semialdehyde dehydrogenase